MAFVDVSPSHVVIMLSLPVAAQACPLAAQVRPLGSPAVRASPSSLTSSPPQSRAQLSRSIRWSKRDKCSHQAHISLSGCRIMLVFASIAGSAGSFVLRLCARTLRFTFDSARSACRNRLLKRDPVLCCANTLTWDLVVWDSFFVIYSCVL